ncbi:MAG TPA: A/G-specific adenine glycosylase [Actinomycetota bacterium]|nr:A/G-specific adenine glycosylase [Actinomycetota bacterium]
MTPVTRRLLDWYRPRRRAYPWRESADPYRVLVSEVMLQQTQAVRVAPAYARFVSKFPTIRDLAAAPRSQVIRAWAGLGHNRRAVALSETARAIVRDGGRVPSSIEQLVALPGVGPYTAAAVSAIAFGRPVPAIDTNVTRVVARHRLGAEAAGVSAVRISREAEAWLDPTDPGAWNQAVMDLGREVCRPRPRCDRCPLAAECRAFAIGITPRPKAEPRPRFEGSSRQVRGAIVRVLRGRPASTVAALEGCTGFDRARIGRALCELHRDGVVAAGPAALAGRPRGRARLAE